MRVDRASSDFACIGVGELLRFGAGRHALPTPVDALEVRIRATADALLDAVDDPDGFDLMAAFAQPLPIIVIAEMLGVPAEHRDRFKL